MSEFEYRIVQYSASEQETRLSALDVAGWEPVALSTIWIEQYGLEYHLLVRRLRAGRISEDGP